MDALLSWLPLIGCAAVMLVVCIPMMKSMHKGNGDKDTVTPREIAELREEIARLRAEGADPEQETSRG